MSIRKWVRTFVPSGIIPERWTSIYSVFDRNLSKDLPLLLFDLLSSIKWLTNCSWHWADSSMTRFRPSRSAMFISEQKTMLSRPVKKTFCQNCEENVDFIRIQQKPHGKAAIEIFQMTHCNHGKDRSRSKIGMAVVVESSSLPVAPNTVHNTAMCRFLSVMVEICAHYHKRSWDTHRKATNQFWEIRLNMHCSGKAHTSSGTKRSSHKSWASGKDAVMGL